MEQRLTCRMIQLWKGRQVAQDQTQIRSPTMWQHFTRWLSTIDRCLGSQMDNWTVTCKTTAYQYQPQVLIHKTLPTTNSYRCKVELIKTIRETWQDIWALSPKYENDERKKRARLWIIFADCESYLYSGLDPFHGKPADNNKHNYNNNISRFSASLANTRHTFSSNEREWCVCSLGLPS